MKKKRREFLKQTAFTGIGIAAGGFPNLFASDLNTFIPLHSNITSVENNKFDEQHLTIIGLY